jgi:cellobionic acid phosphorylase
MAKLIRTDQDGQRVGLQSPTDMPSACGFLWNREMLLQVNCRGYVTGQHMQPEPAKYSHAPIVEERTFMQPEQPFYAHHPGRFFYVRDVENGEMFSVPYEPVRHKPDSFLFSVGRAGSVWRVAASARYFETGVQLPADDVVVGWRLVVGSGGSWGGLGSG